MKFREWLEGVQKLKVELSEVEESLYADGHSITVSIRDKVYGAVDGKECDVRYLRPYFTHHKDNFVAMLEALTDRCKAIAETTELAQNIAAYDAIPGAVIDRLKGEDTDDLVKRSVEKKLLELNEVVGKIADIFEEFEYEFPPFGIYEMSLSQTRRSIHFKWGKSGLYHFLSGSEPSVSVSGTDNFQEQLMFLGNFSVIKARLEEFVAIVGLLPKKAKKD